jgi:hypothetical protein
VAVAWFHDRLRARYKRSIGDRTIAIGENEILALASAKIGQSTQRMNRISQDYWSGGTLPDWQTRAQQEMLNLHADLFILGRGGFQSMTNRDRSLLQKILRFHSYKLDQFYKDLVGGDYSEGRARDRLRLYAQSARNSFLRGRHEAMKAAGLTQAQRSLNPLVREHCKQCPGYDTNGKWVGINLVVLPGELCDCGARCRCNVKYR